MISNYFWARTWWIVSVLLGRVEDASSFDCCSANDGKAPFVLLLGVVISPFSRLSLDEQLSACLPKYEEDSKSLRKLQVTYCSKNLLINSQLESTVHVWSCLFGADLIFGGCTAFPRNRPDFKAAKLSTELDVFGDDAI